MKNDIRKKTRSRNRRTNKYSAVASVFVLYVRADNSCAFYSRWQFGCHLNKPIFCLLRFVFHYNQNGYLTHSWETAAFNPLLPDFLVQQPCRAGCLQATAFLNLSDNVAMATRWCVIVSQVIVRACADRLLDSSASTGFWQSKKAKLCPCHNNVQREWK